MYKDLINKLRELPHLLFVQLGEHEDVVYQAADAIEVLDMKLQGANAAIAGMQREIERMVIDSVNSKPKWISVTERLPKPYMRDAQGRIVHYLVMLMDENLILMASRTDKCWIYRGDGSRLKGVTHWMPLPQPPVEGI